MLGHAQILPQERAALINLFNATSGAGWTHTDNWCSGVCPTSGSVTFNAPGTECTWFGVYCDYSRSRVWMLTLCGNHLVGALPDLSRFKELGRIEICNNQLTGNLPDLARMVHLAVFIAGNNQFYGQLPLLSQLKSLELFYVDHNQFTGPIPDLTGLPLSGFDVSHNWLTGAVPALPTPTIHPPWIQLCPNPLDTTPRPDDANWNRYTGFTPWWANPYPNNQCDDIFTGQFELIPLPSA